MKKTLAIALLASAFVMPGILAAADNVRFAPIPADKLTAKQNEFIKALTDSPRSGNGGGGNINNPPFKVYMRSPEYGIEAIKISDYLRFDTGLDNRLTELAIIIAARNWDNDYIWTAHYGAAVKAGVDPSVGADIAAGKRPAKMKDDEAIVYDLLTEIYRDRKVSDATFAKTVGKYGEKGIMDIIGLAAYYGNTAMALIVANGTRPAGNEPKLQKLTQNFPK
jgi:4-carboxymuconolactone decarboxylase